VVPALDPSTPIYASSFVMELIKRRLTEYNLWDDRRFITFEMRERFNAGPFQCVGRLGWDTVVTLMFRDSNVRDALL
jgi:hypothetical protein